MTHERREDLVSIVTPAWRAARFVGETIRSVQAQGHRDWEMLVVDDCSPDDTVAVVSSFADRDPRIRLIRQPANGGPAAARNAALEAATGRYLAFLDSDDLWLPNKLSAQLAFMRAKSVAFSYTEFRRISEDGSRIGDRVQVPDSLTYRQLLCDTSIATSTVMIDRSLAGEFRMKKTYYDDFTAWLEILRRGHVAYGLHEDLMRYRVVGKSVSRNKLRSATMVWRAYREIEGLGVLDSGWCLLNYAVRGALKYRRF
jgi:teichuronic acid biosynthesis glycosyltransferase TuaG